MDRNDSFPELEPGERIELIGVARAGKFAPIAQANSIKVLGLGTLPKAPFAKLAELTEGTLDSQWRSVKGFVRTAEVKSLWGRETLVLELDLGGGTLITARVRDFDPEAWHRLPASFISLEGVCGTVFNDRRQFIAVRFFVSSLKNISILRPGPIDLFHRPLQSLSSLTRFSTERSAFEPIKVQGTVTSVQKNREVYLQSGTEAALVKVSGEAPVSAGDFIEVVGYPTYGDYAPLLEGSSFRLLPGHNHVEPLSLPAASVIVNKDGFPSSPYDALLIRVIGKVTQIIPGEDDSLFFLQDGETNFTARLPGPSAKMQLPAVGSLLQLTGICFTRVDDAHEPNGFRLFLQEPSDVVVRQAGPWWNSEHSKQVVFVLVIVLIVMMCLLMVSRREATWRQLSLSDPLTGIHNRRGFTLLAEQQWRLALRKRSTMLLFYIDLDEFKEINDTFGHKQGDLALQTTAEILRECFRSSDVIGRIGGDEFAVVACEAMPESQPVLEERLRTLTAKTNQRLQGSFHLSFSVGALECRPDMMTMTVEDLLAKADEMMYRQKAIRHKQEPATQSAALAKT